MYWKNCGSPFSVVTVSIFASLAGLITLECPSFAYSQQQPTINTFSKVISANTTEEVSLQKNMIYAETRQLLIKQGWQPHLQGELPNLSDYKVRELFQLGYPEIKDCAGTGEGLCRFEFINGKGKLLVVVTKSQGYGNKNQFIRNWWIEKNPHITQQNSANKIVPGFYELEGTNQGLEVKGQRYRYYDEIEEKPWESISDLKYITNAVVFDGKNYWCLSTLAPRNKPAVCSANEWIQTILPFLGTRFFNFLGGSGTGQSITIKNDGIAIVKIHGTMNTSVIYEGKFSNPLILKDGFGLLFKDNKVYQLNPSGQISKGCRGEGKLCESDLYQP